MKQINTIFQLLVALYFAVALIFFLAFDSIRNAFNIQELTAGKVVIWLLVGAGLFIVSWLLDNVYVNGLHKDIRKLELEKNELKARMYDMEQDVKISRVEKKIETIDEDKEPSKIRPRQNFK
ncbi:hypothetical protein KI659_06740 [Litoribacter alkaliphilus]|uniref:Uncharacterized protein n=1 Tax=Litoribacter ruber TaxID=702568 RepID=A0AAP2G0Y9_9BACT|nr:hypothetical protein [Litoribacter alkaliphilus]MBS9523714.1 hypothetical protein [Litoribacter alkaliphilus]